MIIEKQSLENVLLITPEVFKDERGYFFKTYRDSTFKDNNLNIKFVQDNEVFSKSKKAPPQFKVEFNPPVFTAYKLPNTSR